MEHPKQSPAIAESKQLEDDVPILDTANQQMESVR